MYFTGWKLELNRILDNLDFKFLFDENPIFDLVPMLFIYVRQHSSWQN